MPAQTTVFKSNRSQAVRIPKEIAFDDKVKNLFVRRQGKSIILTPVDALWDDFFDMPGCPDFPDRAPQGEFEKREEF